MAVWPPWHTNARKSANDPVGEQDIQLTEHQIPVLVSGVPVLHDTRRGQIQHPAQGVVIREGGLILRDLPELAVQASMIFVVYLIFRISTGDSKNVL